MRLFVNILIFASLLCVASIGAQEKELAPSHLMVGVGAFDFDREKRPTRALVQIEYRWEVHCHHVRPLAAFFITTDTNFFVCGGVGYDIFLGKKLVITPSFAPGLYYHGHGKKLGFPLNFRSGIEVAYVFHNQGRLVVQCNHISNAHIFWKNPGANSLILFYAIPFPVKKKGCCNANS